MELNLFGKFTLTKDGEPVELRNKKAQALLVYLALTGKTQSREQLATLLWGDRFDDQARASLRQALFVLRKAVGPDVILGEDELHLSEDLNLTVRTIQASETYPGDLMAGFRTGEEQFDNWLEQERVGLKEKALQLYREAAKQAATSEDFAQAHKLALQVLDLDSFDEDALRLAMVALAETDCPREALRLCEAFSTNLQRDLGATPSPETRALEQQIRDARRAGNLDSMEGKNLFLGKTLVAPIADLGGGDIASFLAHEIPKSMVEYSMDGMLLKASILTTSDHLSSENEVFELAKAAGDTFLVTGSTRQIGDKVRVSLQISEIEPRMAIFSHSEVIPVDNAFDFLEEVGALFQSGIQRSWANRQPSSGSPIARFNALKNDEMRFINALQDYFASVFYSNNTRDGFAEMDRIADLAVSKFPKSPFCLQFKGWSVYSLGDMSGGNQRYARYREASDYFDRALAIDPSHQQSLMGRFSVSYWLGDFATTDKVHDLLSDGFKAWPVLKAIHANSLIFRDRTDEALELYAPVLIHEAGLKTLLNRHAMIGMAHYCGYDYGEALNSALRSLEIGTDYWVTHIVRIAALERLGRHKEALSAIDDYTAEYPNPNVEEMEWLPFVNQQLKEDLLSALRDAGLPQTVVSK